MTMPRWASLLLDNLGQRELAGDLAEEASAGRSRLWLWAQVAAAVLVGVKRAISADRQLAIESIVVGWALLYLMNLIVDQFVTRPLVLELFPTGLTAWQVGALHLPALVVPPALSSFLLARLHPRSSFGMTGAFIVTVFAQHAGSVAFLVAANLHAGEAISWTNVLNVPLTFGLMVGGGALGARRLTSKTDCA